MARTAPYPDTIGALIFGELFNRFPHLRFMIVELGAYWLPGPVEEDGHDLEESNSFKANIDEPPSEIYKQHFWICPYY